MKNDDAGERFRMDFIIEVVSVDDATRTFTARLIPNPKRYDWRVIDGKRYLFDKLDKTLIPENVLNQMHLQAKNLPIVAQPQLVGRAEKYVEGRFSEIDKALSGTTSLTTLADKSEEFLRSLETDKLGFVILCLDIVGSTELITKREADFLRMVAVAQFEFSSVVPLFHGHVLKYTGDGLIAYFPEPNFITKNDLAIDCGLTMLRLVRDGLNPCFRKHGLPDISIRIGLDSGDAYIQTVGSPATKQHKDIIGCVVSLAAKIQGTALPGGIHLGQVTFQNLHTDWRLKCSPVALPPDWQYSKKSDGTPYPVFAFQGRPSTAKTA